MSCPKAWRLGAARRRVTAHAEHDAITRGVGLVTPLLSGSGSLQEKEWAAYAGAAELLELEAAHGPAIVEVFRWAGAILLLEQSPMRAMSRALLEPHRGQVVAFAGGRKGNAQ